MGAKKHKQEEHENHERWLVSYADFITLLFAFFTVLYATSQQDLEKEKKFEESFRQQMTGIIGSAGNPDGSEFDSQMANDNVISSPFPGRRSAPSEIQEHVQNRLDKEMTKAEYQEVVEAVHHDAYGVRIQLAANAIFPSASADLKEGAISALEKIGEILRASNRKLIIEGHTDNEPIQSSRYPSNWELSAARATKIARFLTQRLQIDPVRIVPIAYASNKPLVPNTSAENRARNRRIEIMIVNGDETSP